MVSFYLKRNEKIAVEMNPSGKWKEGALLHLNNRVVEGDDVFGAILLVECHGRTWVSVQLARDHVREVVPPLQILPHWLDVLLDALQNRPQFELRVV